MNIWNFAGNTLFVLLDEQKVEFWTLDRMDTNEWAPLYNVKLYEWIGKYEFFRMYINTLCNKEFLEKLRNIQRSQYISRPVSA